MKANAPEMSGRVWQRNYYEHVIRNDTELNRIREYISNNPLQWQFDHENPAREANPAYDHDWSWLAVRPAK